MWLTHLTLVACSLGAELAFDRLFARVYHPLVSVKRAFGGEDFITPTAFEFSI